jgi:cytochrome c biogenesis factor
VILLFAFLSTFDLLLKFLCSFLFFSYFSLMLPYVCVVNALIKGEIESLCGSRTGGWSLPGVMSD